MCFFSENIKAIQIKNAKDPFWMISVKSHQPYRPVNLDCKSVKDCLLLTG